MEGKTLFEEQLRDELGWALSETLPIRKPEFYAIFDSIVAAHQAELDRKVLEELKRLYRYIPMKVPDPIAESPLELTDAAIAYNDAVHGLHNRLNRRIAEIEGRDE